MKLTQGQVRELTGLTEPTLRIWSRVVPPLMDRKGKGLNFTVGDVVALLLIESAVRGLGCSISVVAPLTPALFSACGLLAAEGARSGCVILKDGSVTVLHEVESIPFDPSDPPFAVIPVAAALARVFEWMGRGQLSLPL